VAGEEKNWVLEAFNRLLNKPVKMQFGRKDAKKPKEYDYTDFADDKTLAELLEGKKPVKTKAQSGEIYRGVGQ
jgi:hypothetical protein